jgi:Mrp family chromosome partitioning ATPase
MLDLDTEMAELWTSLGAPTRGRARAIEFIAARDGEGTSSVAREFAYFAAQTVRRRVWLIDLDLMGQTQAESLAAEPDRYGALGPATAASPDGSMFFTVQPPLRRPDGRPWPDARYTSAHAVGDSGLWVTRFRRDVLRGRQNVHITPDAAYWTALRRHADLIVVDAPAAERSQAGLTVAPAMDQVVIVVAADGGDARAPSMLRDELAEAGARLAGVFVNRVQIEAPPFLRGAAP